MKVDNFVLLIISILTLIIISLVTECNRGRLKELEDKATQEIKETFFGHLGLADPTESGEWGYKITNITEGQYGGRAKQEVLNTLILNGVQHNVDDYITDTEKSGLNNIIDSSIDGEELSCGNVQFNDCQWTDGSGTILDPADSSGIWTKTIRSIDYNVNQECGNVGDLRDCYSNDDGVQNDVNCDNTPLLECGSCSDQPMKYNYNTNPRRMSQYNGNACNTDVMSNQHINNYCMQPTLHDTWAIFDYPKIFTIHSQDITNQKQGIMHNKAPLWHKHQRTASFKFNIRKSIGNSCSNKYLNLNLFEIYFNYTLDGTDDSSAQRKMLWSPTAIIRNVQTYAPPQVINGVTHNVGKIKSFEIYATSLDTTLRKYLYNHINTNSRYNTWKNYAGNDAVVLFNGCCGCNDIANTYYKFGYDTLPGTTSTSCPHGNSMYRPASGDLRGTFRDGMASSIGGWVSSMGIHNSKLRVNLWTSTNYTGSHRAITTTTSYDNLVGGYHMGGGTRLIGMGSWNDDARSVRVDYTGASFMEWLYTHSHYKVESNLVIKIERVNENSTDFKVTYITGIGNVDIPIN